MPVWNIMSYALDTIPPIFIALYIFKNSIEINQTMEVLDRRSKETTPKSVEVSRYQLLFAHFKNERMLSILILGQVVNSIAYEIISSIQQYSDLTANDYNFQALTVVAAFFCVNHELLTFALAIELR